MTIENLKKILREYGVYKYCSDWEALIESLMSEYEEAYSEGYDYAKMKNHL